MRISDWSSDVCSSDLLRGEEQPRCEHDETEREIGRKGLDGEEKERRDERQAQIQRVEAEILAHGLADTEEGVAAAEEVGGFTVHFFLSLWLRASPLTDADCIAKAEIGRSVVYGKSG